VEGFERFFSLGVSFGGRSIRLSSCHYRVGAPISLFSLSNSLSFFLSRVLSLLSIFLVKFACERRIQTVEAQQTHPKHFRGASATPLCLNEIRLVYRQFSSHPRGRRSRMSPRTALNAFFSLERYDSNDHATVMNCRGCHQLCLGGDSLFRGGNLRGR